MEGQTEVGSLSELLRCYIEDFILLDENKEVIILMPQQDSKFNEYPYKHIIIGNITFNKFNATVIIYPYSDKLEDNVSI